MLIKGSLESESLVHFRLQSYFGIFGVEEACVWKDSYMSSERI